MELKSFFDGEVSWWRRKRKKLCATNKKRRACFENIYKYKLSKKNNKENPKDTQLPINVHHIVGTAFLSVNWLVHFVLQLSWPSKRQFWKWVFFSFTKEFHLSPSIEGKKGELRLKVNFNNRVADGNRRGRQILLPAYGQAELVGLGEYMYV